ETIVCVDEAYYEYAGETTAPHARERTNFVCVRTLSKAFGLAGLRVGYAIASRTVAGVLTDRRAPGPIANVPAALGAEALRSPAIAQAEAAVVLEGSGRVSSRTDDEDRDRAIEERAAASGWDLEVVAEPGTSAAAIERALAAAEERATRVPTG